MIFGLLSLMSFQLIDSIFVGRLGIEPLAAIGYTIPIYQLIIGLQVGIGIATTALISQRLGANKEQDARALAGSILIIGCIAIVSLSSLIWLVRAQLLEALGASSALMPLIADYWQIFLLASVVGAVVYFGYSICRAHGNTVLPGIGMVLTSLLNIAFDPLFIFYFELGLNGAAWATLAAFSCGILLTYPKLFAQHWLGLAAQFSDLLGHLKEVIAIALPAMISQLLPALAAMITTFLVSDFGTEVIAAWGLGVRLEFFGIVLVLALTMSLPPMIGRYYGARDISHIRGLVGIAVKFIVAWQLGFAILLASFAQPLASFMAGREQVAEQLYWIIVLLPISYAPLGVCILCVSVCNAIDASKRALLISGLRLFACYLPFLALGAELGGFSGLVAGAALGNLCAGLMAWRLYQHRLRCLQA